MWIFSQLTGAINNDKFKTVVYFGYAGHENGKTNPSMQAVKDVGPLPCGFYTMTEVIDSEKTGPFTIILVPDESNRMFTRCDFRIHGDSKEHPRLASDGCIVAPLEDRKAIWYSGDRRLQVVSGTNEPISIT